MRHAVRESPSRGGGDQGVGFDFENGCGIGECSDLHHGCGRPDINEELGYAGPSMRAALYAGTKQRNAALADTPTHCKPDGQGGQVGRPPYPYILVIPPEKSGPRV